MKVQDSRECKNCAKVCSKYLIFRWDKFLLCKKCTMDLLQGKDDEK
jgi:hypothetical protein